jgi:hypothetical protein
VERNINSEKKNQDRQIERKDRQKHRLRGKDTQGQLRKGKIDLAKDRLIEGEIKYEQEKFCNIDT